MKLNAEFHLKIALLRLSGLIRTRVILSLIGLWVMYKQPIISHDVVAIIGLALGVSAVDAFRDSRRRDDGEH